MTTTAPKNITPNRHEKTEWTRLAHWAYNNGKPSVGAYYIVNASMLDGESLTTAQFDALQAGYREWLIDGTVTTVETRHERFMQDWNARQNGGRS